MQTPRLRLPRAPWFAAIAVATLAVFLALAFASQVSAHAELERAAPPPDGLLAAPPREIELWTTERISVGAGSPGLRVLDESGSEQTISNLRVDPNDPRHLLAGVSGIGAGTYTVVWTVLSEDDGHWINGSYAFRVGTGRAPGAASVEGESPLPWAVATRWITFLGAAIAAAGFVFGAVLLPGAAADGFARRRARWVFAAAGIALAATLLEPMLQTWFPPAGAIEPSLGDAIAALPDAWWFRPAGLALALALGAIASSSKGRLSRSNALAFAGLAASLAALLGLALTSHASARETWRIVATPSIILHQWTVALWVGGLVHLALARWRLRAPDATDDGSDPVRRFSRYALGLAGIGIATGVLNSGLVLPSLRSLWTSDYGGFLIAKVAILVPVLALATFHRLALRRLARLADQISLSAQLVRVGATFRTTLRLEAAIVLFVVLGGSILALMAPPTVARGDIVAVDLAATTASAQTAGTGSPMLIKLEVSPARPGDNQFAVLVSNLDRSLVPPDQIALVRLDFVSLDEEAEQRDIATSPDARGRFASGRVQLGLAGWWRVNVLIRRLGVEDAIVPFYVRLPDPNVNGFDDDPPRGPDDAKAIYERGLTGMTTLGSVHWTQRLSGGSGEVVESEHMVSDGTDGNPPAALLRSADFEQIVVGDRRWQRQAGGQWLESEAAPLFTPAEWGETYAGATAFRLGRIEEVDGRQAQIVTFYVPSTGRLAAAYYAWWVSIDSGRVLRETMVSRLHYMVYTYRDFDQTMPIAPPVS